MKKKYYAILRGRLNNKVVDTWLECSNLVTGHKGAKFKGFKYKEDAIKYAKVGKAKKHYVLPAKVTKHIPAPIKEDMNFTVDLTRKGECLMRGRFMNNPNRCLSRFQATTVGNDYIANVKGSPF